MPDRTLALAGDVMLGRLVDEALAERGPEDPWRAVRPLLEGSDAFLFNLECAVCGELPEWEPSTKTFHFRLDASRAAALAASGVDAVQVANNHVMDHGEEGMLETLRALDALGIAHAGAGRTLDEARAPATLPGGLALVAAADHLAEWAAGPRRPGLFLVDPGSLDSARDVADAVRAAREAGAETVVLGLHWGPNMRRAPPPEFRWFAREAVDHGADVVWGTSAHLFQGIEFYHGRVILYDAGDFLDDYAVDPDERNDRSFLFLVRLDEAGRAREVALRPVLVEDRRVVPAPPEDAAWSIRRMEALCAPLGTRLDARGDEWVATPALAEPPRRGLPLAPG